jgi:4-diphosphocytidyl-2-C-methyl-D-erythritol kinase
MTPLRLEAPAKLNLTLAVVGRRADGLHELVTEMVLLELADRLLLMPGCSGLRVDGPTAEAVPVDGANLAWRGLRAGLGAEPELVCLALEKLVPVAAGLGGGSSDAAAAWRLARRWTGGDEMASAADLQALSRIGADVPFFATRMAAARVEGIGERVVSIPPPALTPHVVLAHPRFALRTGDVFGELRREEWSGAEAEPSGNDLLAPARRLRPDLDDVLRLVVAAGGDPRLSGSGPTVFSLTDDPQRAAAVAGRLERAGLRATRTRIRLEPASIEAIEEMEE